MSFFLVSLLFINRSVPLLVSVTGKVRVNVPKLIMIYNLIKYDYGNLSIYRPFKVRPKGSKNFRHLSGNLTKMRRNRTTWVISR